jgi:hypothetical protein
MLLESAVEPAQSMQTEMVFVIRSIRALVLKMNAAYAAATRCTSRIWRGYRVNRVRLIAWMLQAIAIAWEINWIHLAFVEVNASRTWMEMEYAIWTPMEMSRMSMCVTNPCWMLWANATACARQMRMVMDYAITIPMLMAAPRTHAWALQIILWMNAVFAEEVDVLKEIVIALEINGMTWAIAVAIARMIQMEMGYAMMWIHARAPWMNVVFAMVREYLQAIVTVSVTKKMQ